MKEFYIFLAVLIILIILLIIYYVYNQILWSKVNKPYAKGEFDNAIKMIDKVYPHAIFNSRKKLIVYKTSAALMNNDEKLFLDTINLIDKKNKSYLVYYYYYYLAYYIIHDDFTKAESIYGILTSKFHLTKEFDLITPLAILAAQKGDSKALKKLKDLKRKKHMDSTFLFVANDYLRKHKRND